MFSGENRVEVTPGHMPNPAVKLNRADGTIWGTYGRVGYCRKTV